MAHGSGHQTCNPASSEENSLLKDERMAADVAAICPGLHFKRPSSCKVLTVSVQPPGIPGHPPPPIRLRPAAVSAAGSFRRR